MDDSARRAARPPRPDRHQEGLRSRPMRRLHGAGRRAADQFLPDAGGDEGRRRGHDDRRAGRQTARCIRCSRPSSTTTPSSAATARRARSARPSGLIAEGKAKTADEIRELMSGNICRCGAYPNIVAAIQQAMEAVMINFQYARASDVADAVRQIAGRPGREIHRRRHQSDRPDEGGRRAPVAADRHHAAAARRGRGDR